MNELKEVLQRRNVEEKKDVIINLESVDLSNKELYEDKSNIIETEFLLEKKIMYENFRVKGALYLGKFWEDVAQKLSNNKTGKYTAFVRDLGENERTVLRYRNRYKVYSMVLNEENRKIIASSSMSIIEQLLNAPSNFIKQLSDGEKYENVINQLKLPEKSEENNEVSTAKKENNLNDFQIREVSVKDILNNVFNKFEMIENLDEKKKIKVAKLLMELNKLLENN